jgi:MYXO-CTERM domain-containing protein
MRETRIRLVLGVAMFLGLPASYARAHWCDDMWISSYNISVRPDSDTSPKALYVQNNMGYQLPTFKLTATSSSGGAVTLTPPTTLKTANTLLPGEKGIWKIASGSPAKIEDLTFSVAFGDDVPNWTNQDSCYPLAGSKPVMVVKNDGSLFPPTPTGIDNPKAPPDPCVKIVALGRSLQYPVIADFEDTNAGLDKLLQYYCAGRGSWGIDDAVTKSCCKDTSSTTCPTTKSSSFGAVSDYVHLWALGEMAIRKSAMGARLPVLRERLKCGVNDGDMGFAGFALFILGYLGDDAGAKTFLQEKANAGGDLGTIAKAALYMAGDSARKADVQAGVSSSSVFVKVACAGALGIVDKDDGAVTTTIFPQVKWNNPSSASEDGKGMYAAHVLQLVALNRRGWVAKGMADGPVTFYGETGGGSGGTSGGGGATGSGGASGSGGGSGTVGSGGSSGTVGSGGRTGNRDGGSSGGAPGTGGRSSGAGGTVESGGSSGSAGSQGVGGGANNGGQAAGGAETKGSGGASGSGGSSVSGEGGESGSGGSTSQGSSPGSGGGSKTAGEEGQGSGCACNLGGRPEDVPALFALAGLGILLARRRRR